MKQQIAVLILTITSLCLGSCKKDVSSTATSSKLSSAETLLNTAAQNKANEKGLPFTGEYTDAFEMLQPPPMFVQKVMGSGIASLIGKSTFEAIVHVNRSTPPPFAVTGTRTITAANGDQIFTTLSGTSIPVAPGVNKTELIDVINGGTGRFANASGSFNSSAIADVKNSIFTASFNGRIAF